MSSTWVCPGELLPRVTHNLRSRSKCVGPQRSGAFNAPAIANTMLPTGLLPPIPIQYPRRQRQSRVETNLQTFVGVPFRHSVLPSHKQPRHTTAARKKLGDKPKDMQTHGKVTRPRRGKSSATSPKTCKHIEM